MPRPAAKKTPIDERTEDDIIFFSETDMNEKGAITGEYPLWYFEYVANELRENIRMGETALEKGFIPDARRSEAREKLAQDKKRLHDIEQSKPKLTDAQKDKLAKILDELGQEIKPALFSRSDMMKGLASPHVEADRMTMPIFKLTAEQARIAYVNGMPITKDRKCTRTTAERLYKIVAASLGEEDRNTERLRRD